MTKTKHKKLGSVALLGHQSHQHKMGHAASYSIAGQPAQHSPKSHLAHKLRSLPKPDHRAIFVALSALTLLVAVTGMVAAVSQAYGQINPKKDTATNGPVITTATVAAPASSKPVSSTPKSKAPTKPLTKQTSAALQQTPQLPPRNSNPSAPFVGSLPDTAPVYDNGFYNYYYAGGRQYATASGVSVSFSQTQPAVPQPDATENHSLIELAVESSDTKQIIEVGWVVDKVLNGDDLPHLFIYHWADGQGSCYNACGFVQVSQSVIPGQAVVSGATANYGISYSSGSWNITYNGATVGYFPASIWGGTFTQFGFLQVFGEVALSHSSSTQCIQMGNGQVGASPTSAKVSDFALTGSNVGVALSPFATAPSSYSYGSASATGLNLGGPGSC